MKGLHHNPPLNNSPLPSYAVKNPIEGTLDITAAFSNLNLARPHDKLQKPTANQCLAHLKLLEAFHQLRQDIALQMVSLASKTASSNHGRMSEIMSQSSRRSA